MDESVSTYHFVSSIESKPLEIAAAPLSRPVAMSVLNESLSLTPATPASGLDREIESEDVVVTNRDGAS